MNRRGIYYPNRPLTEAKQPKPVSKSRVLLICGCVVCGVGTITAILALTLPYWVYFSETMETTVAGLTDPTEVKVFYGLLKYCLMMKATHLDIDRCDDRTTGDLLDWEYITYVLICVSIAILPVAIVMVLLNIFYRNMLTFLVLSAVAANTAGVCLAVGVCFYQINATTQILDIAGLATKNFEPDLLNVSFKLAFASSVIGFLGGILLMFGTFTWEKPKGPRKMPPSRYKTIVKPVRFPHRNRQPVPISVTYM